MAVFTPGYLTLRLTSPSAPLRRRWELDPNNLHPVAACKKVDNGAYIISLQVQRLKRWGTGHGWLPFPVVLPADSNLQCPINNK